MIATNAKCQMLQVTPSERDVPVQTLGSRVSCRLRWGVVVFLAGLFAMLMVAAGAGAEGLPSEQLNVTIETTCIAFGLMAADVMKERQSGVPLQTMVLRHQAPNTLIDHMVIKAYDEPLKSDPVLQARIIENFKRQSELDCIAYYSQGD